jgi:hypothetical protein
MTKYQKTIVNGWLFIQEVLDAEGTMTSLFGRFDHTPDAEAVVDRILTFLNTEPVGYALLNNNNQLVHSDIEREHVESYKYKYPNDVLVELRPVPVTSDA